VERYIIRGEPFWVKRDDLLSLPGTNLSGNKARKLFALHSMPQERLPKAMGFCRVSIIEIFPTVFCGVLLVSRKIHFPQ